MGKRIFGVAVVLVFGLTTVVMSQQAKPVSEQMPGLSTSEKVALQALEKQKQDAQQEFQSANQQEQQIRGEWGMKNPGWHLNPATYAVEKDAMAETPRVKTTAGGENRKPVVPAVPAKK